MSLVNVYSEIGKLQRVMVHRPGKEIENLTPDTLSRLLFDDIPYLKIAIEEHDHFAKILRDHGAEVVYVEELAAEVLADPALKNAFLDDMLYESAIFSKSLKQALKEYLLALSTPDMIAAVCAGVRKKEISYQSSSLSDLIKEDYEFYLDPMPNLYFTRDPGACVGGALSLNTMKTVARRRETLFLKYVHKFHKLFGAGQTPLLYDRTLPHSIEGGDILVLSKDTVAIGCSLRTRPEAIEHFAEQLFAQNAGFKRVLVLEIQKKRAYMHLDTVLTMVDHDKFSVHPEIERDVIIYEITPGTGGALAFRHVEESLGRALARVLGIGAVELIQCGGGDPIISAREQWNDGANTLALAPGYVVTYDRNYVSNELFDKKGVKIVSMPSAELSRGRGGPRCMSMPIAREAL